LRRFHKVDGKILLAFDGHRNDTALVLDCGLILVELFSGEEELGPGSGGAASGHVGTLVVSVV
jgi:hypothetical protein